MRGCGLLVLATFACFVSEAAAAVYRCEVDGAAVYTDRPCAADAQPHAMAPIGTVPAAAAADLVADHDRRRARQFDARERADAAWLEAHARRRENEARIDAAVAERRVVKGMSADQVRGALGSPDAVAREDGRERWTYGRGKQRRTVVLEHGKVTRAPAAGAR